MADTQCPCKQKLTDGEKGVLGFGLNNDMLKNPNAAATEAAKLLSKKNGGRIAGLITAAQNDPTGALLGAVPSLNRMKTAIESQDQTLQNFENASKSFTDPRYLSTILSSLSLFGELNCALGIEGIDIGVGLNVINNNGQFAIQYSVNANIDIEKILNKFDDGTGNGLGTDLANKAKDLQSGIDSAFAALDEANSKLQGIMDSASGLQNQAADFIQKYTSITTLANLINFGETDPCFKLGKTVNGSLVTPEFLNAVRTAGLGGGGVSNR